MTNETKYLVLHDAPHYQVPTMIGYVRGYSFMVVDKRGVQRVFVVALDDMDALTQWLDMVALIISGGLITIHVSSGILKEIEYEDGKGVYSKYTFPGGTNDIIET